MILWVDQNITNSSLEASQWSFHWVYTGFSGCHQVATRGFQCEKSEVKIHSLLMFEGLWHPLMSKVTGIGSPAEVRSWDPRVLWCHTHPRCYPANTVRDSQLKLEKCQILEYRQGGTVPYYPRVTPYLRGNMWKKESLFTYLFIFAHFGNLILELNTVPGVLLEPYMSQGDQGVTETPIVLKGLRSGWAENT